METLTERLKRLVPGSNTGGTAPVQPRAGIKMPASGYRAPSIPSPIQTGPGVTPVKIRLNAPGKALGKGQAAAAVLGLAEMGLAATDTAYGAKVRDARAGLEATREGATDYVLDGLSGAAGAVGNFFNGMGGAKATTATDGRQYSIQQPESAARVPNFGGPEYKQQEQDMINAALLHQGQQNRQRQLKADETMGMLDDDYKATEAAAFEAAAEAGDPQPNFIRAAAGTDTSTGLRDRGPAASEFVGKEDEAMAIWAKANPNLAQAMVEKVERARVNSPDFKQTGYDAVKKYLDPSYDKDARSQTFGPVANAEEYGRNLALQGTGGIGPVSDAGLYGDLLEGKEKPNTQTFKTAKEKVQKRLSTTTDKSNETAAELPPSVTQNPNFDPEITSQYNAAGLKGGGVTRDIFAESRKKSIRPI